MKNILIFLFLCLLASCRNDYNEIDIKSTEKKEIENFFNYNFREKSRSSQIPGNLKDLQVIIETLKTSDNILYAIRTYKDKYGYPLWENTASIKTENGKQYYVPIYSKKNPDEIRSIWCFYITNNKLYNYTIIRNYDSKIVEEYWKFDYFTKYVLNKNPRTKLKFKVQSSRTAIECVYAYIEIEISGMIEISDQGLHCWEININDLTKAFDRTDVGGGGGGFNGYYNIDGSGGGSSDSGGGGSGGSGGTNSKPQNKKATVDITTLRSNANKVINNLKNKYGIEKAVCNFSVRDIFKSLFDSNELDNKRANEILHHLKSSPNWEEVRIEHVQSLANEGCFVVSGYNNPYGSGHVSVIMPGNGEYGNWNGNYILLPYTMDAGAGVADTKLLISYGYGKSKQANVKFYYYKK